jgi:hypothetical protein
VLAALAGEGVVMTTASESTSEQQNAVARKQEHEQYGRTPLAVGRPIDSGTEAREFRERTPAEQSEPAAPTEDAERRA